MNRYLEKTGAGMCLAQTKKPLPEHLQKTALPMGNPPSHSANRIRNFREGKKQRWQIEEAKKIQNAKQCKGGIA